MSEPHTQAVDFGSAVPDGQRVKVMVAPLIDLVFLLICFYLLVGQLVVHQKDPTVRLAEMTTPLASAESPAELVINLRQDGHITIAGQDVPEADLPGIVSAELTRAAKADQPPRIVIRADRRQSFGRLDTLLKICRKAGVSQVVFRSEKGPQP